MRRIFSSVHGASVAPGRFAAKQTPIAVLNFWWQKEGGNRRSMRHTRQSRHTRWSGHGTLRLPRPQPALSSGNASSPKWHYCTGVSHSVHRHKRQLSKQRIKGPPKESEAIRARIHEVIKRQAERRQNNFAISLRAPGCACRGLGLAPMGANTRVKIAAELDTPTHNVAARNRRLKNRRGRKEKEEAPSEQEHTPRAV